MGLFGRKAGGGPSCPICQEVFARGANVLLHNTQHVIPAADGGDGFMWRCECGESDGVWDNNVGAAAGLTQHMQRKHNIDPL